MDSRKLGWRRKREEFHTEHRAKTGLLYSCVFLDLRPLQLACWKYTLVGKTPSRALSHAWRLELALTVLSGGTLRLSFKQTGPQNSLPVAATCLQPPPPPPRLPLSLLARFCFLSLALETQGMNADFKLWGRAANCGPMTNLPILVRF